MSFGEIDRTVGLTGKAEREGGGVPLEKKCKDCGKLASEVKLFIHSNELCSTCNNRNNIRKRKLAGTYTKRTTKKVKSKPVKKRATKKTFLGVPSITQKAEEVYDFITSQGLSYAEGNIVALICSYHNEGKTQGDLLEAFERLARLIAKSGKKVAI